MKKAAWILSLLLFLCMSGCGANDHEQIYHLYAEGQYETTLTKDNCYTRIEAEESVGIAQSSDPALILIGGAWCPYCAADIGVIDSVFKSSALTDAIKTIYYIDVADSQISATTIMKFNEAFNATIQVKIPCLMFFDRGDLLADRNDPLFKETEDRTQQIQLFFDHVTQILEDTTNNNPPEMR